MKGSDGKWNEGIHINIVKREENGLAWVDNIKSRGKNYPYQKFTWGSITWGSLRNPSKGYGTGSTTTKDEARQQHSDKHSGASSMVNSGEAAKGKAGSGKASSSGGGSGSGSNPSQPVFATKTNVVYGDYTYTWDAISSAWYYQSSDGTTDWVSSQACIKIISIANALRIRRMTLGVTIVRPSRADDDDNALGYRITANSSSNKKIKNYK